MDFLDFDLETYLIIGAILELIIIICFFILCNNVSLIRKRQSYSDRPISVVIAVLLAAGEKEKAKVIMTEYLTDRIASLPGVLPDRVDIENVLKQHASILKTLDINFDVDLFITSRTSFYK